MLTLYGLKVSYFTGKMEAYLRVKGIPFRFQSMTGMQFQRDFPKKLGALQMPVVELDDGRLMTDSSPMIDWLEGETDGPSILPHAPAMAFFARLIEDYADEYLWRPAMHYRWSYWESADLLRRQIADELAGDVPLPYRLKLFNIYRRQRGIFV
ncbi:MAG: glutathione S-transferase N-terminal domain-containing protein, partial [Candidatus Micropelagos thuwalensis]